ncbi:cAMP-specific 3',5'-cyclic phosphodiesterase 4B [Holothuria leucospilota]|uniref:3',5'-cyclic-AMP phosphodiesterase n=1 Tax=Holothuria leucospilota TaxID=206669 RepID=A0A9Q1H8N1_HOLLE|nr:cAMP-specific 3',5'-cyclic phosphodiesterase 4B [Holothuria leucospilota]
MQAIVHRSLLLWSIKTCLGCILTEDKYGVLPYQTVSSLMFCPRVMETAKDRLQRLKGGSRKDMTFPSLLLRRHSCASFMSSKSNSSDDSFDMENGPSPSRSPGLEASSPSSGLVLSANFPQRRESFLYRSDSDFDLSPKSMSRNSSITSESHTSEDIIVTPFAQILASLRNVRKNYTHLTGLPQNLLSRQSPRGQQQPVKTNVPPQDENYGKLASETLEELDWCLEQLESMQSYRSVSDLATSKFKRMLNRELSAFSDTGKSGNQVSEFLFTTFLDKQQEVDLPTLPPPRDLAPSPTNLTRSSSKGRRSNDMGKIKGIQKLKQHNNLSPDALPRFGVSLPHDIPDAEEELERELDNIDKWGMDIFRINTLTNHRPLTCVAYTLFEERNLLKTFNIPAKTFVNYMMTIEDHYNKDVKYHNQVHAADVTHSTHFLLCAPALEVSPLTFMMELLQLLT